MLEDYDDDKNNNDNNLINIGDKDESNNNFYFISCFHNIIWGNKLLNITSTNKSVISITSKNEKIYEKNKNYMIKLHQIIINNNYNDVEKINLYLSDKDDDILLYLGEITIKLEEDKFYFNDIIFDTNNIKQIKKIIKEEINDKNNNFKYYIELDFSTKLNIYNDYIEKNNLKIYAPYLVNNFFSSAKNKLVLYSDIATLFTLSHGNKSLINFFDNCYNFKIKINE